MQPDAGRRASPLFTFFEPVIGSQLVECCHCLKPQVATCGKTKRFVSNRLQLSEVPCGDGRKASKSCLIPSFSQLTQMLVQLQQCFVACKRDLIGNQHSCVSPLFSLLSQDVTFAWKAGSMHGLSKRVHSCSTSESCHCDGSFVETNLRTSTKLLCTLRGGADHS